MTPDTPTHNLTASARRDAVIDAAITEFSLRGLHGTSTEDIAKRAGISQPYIFRLFGTKKDLFLAAADRVCGRILANFEAAAAASGPGTPLDRMGASYTSLLTNREELLMLLHAIAASSDDDVQTRMRRRYSELVDDVTRLSNADRQAVVEFFAFGMLLTVLAAIDLPDVLGYKTWDAFMHEHKLQRS
jgi:AcrR family transcriptional regulator